MLRSKSAARQTRRCGTGNLVSGNCSVALSILHVGSYSPLVEARTRILATLGFEVVSACSASEALALLAASDFDAVILCHSLDQQDLRSIADAVHHQSRRTPVILVAGYRLDAILDAVEDADAVVEPLPQALISQIPVTLKQFQTRPSAA